NHVRDNFGLQFSGGDVVEKEKRAGALDQNVVNAMIHEIAPHGVVNSGDESNLQLCTDAIRRRNQHRMLQTRKRAVKHSPEASDLGKRSLIERASGQLLDLIGCSCRGVYVDARIAV